MRKSPISSKDTRFCFLHGLTYCRQWGNVLTLQAAFDNPILKPLIDKKLLKDLYEKTMAFLKLAAQPSSALSIDCKILDHVAQEIELIPRRGTSASASFPSTTSGDVQMAGQ